MARPTQNGLRSGEFNGRVEALDHRPIAVAGENRPEFLEPESAIHLGKLAASDVELECLGFITQDREFQGSATSPAFDNGFEMGEGRSACGLGRVATRLFCESPDCLGKDFLGSIHANFRGKRPHEGGEDLGFDFALVQEGYHGRCFKTFSRSRDVW